MNQTAPLNPAAALIATIKVIFTDLLKAIADRSGEGVFLWICRGYPDSIAFTWKIYLHMGRVGNRLSRLIERLQTEAPKPFAPVYAKRTRSITPKIRQPDPKTPDFPRGWNWLGSRVFNAGSYGSQLQHSINQPEIRDLIASDYRFARILRPFFHMVGVRNPVIPTCKPPEPAPQATITPEPATPELCQPPIEAAPSGITPSPSRDNKDARRPPPPH